MPPLSGASERRVGWPPSQPSLQTLHTTPHPHPLSPHDFEAPPSARPCNPFSFFDFQRFYCSSPFINTHTRTRAPVQRSALFLLESPASQPARPAIDVKTQATSLCCLTHIASDRVSAPGRFLQSIHVQDSAERGGLGRFVQRVQKGQLGGCAAYKCRRAAAGAQARAKGNAPLCKTGSGAKRDSKSKEALSLQLRGCPVARG